MNTARRMRLLMWKVQFLHFWIFFITLSHLTVIAQHNTPLPTSQTSEDYEKGEEGVEETKVRSGRFEKPHTSTDKMEPERHNTNTTQRSLETRKPSPAPSVSTIPPSLQEVQHINKNYPADFFSVEERRRGWMILHVVGMIYMLVSLIIVCDKFFIPAVGVITDRLSLPEDVAGVTFMAAGRSIPKSFGLLMGVFIDNNNTSIGMVVGPALFNVLFVIGACALCSRESLHLTWWPLFRDMSFYMLCYVLFIIFFLDTVIVWWESVLLVTCFILYAVFMKFNSQAKQAFETRLHKHRRFLIANTAEDPNKDVPARVNCAGDSDEDHRQKHFVVLSENLGNENKVKEEEAGKKDGPLSLRWPVTRCKQISYVLLLPIILPLWLTIPDVHKQKSRKFFLVTYVVSILWIGVFSYLLMWWAHQVGETFGFPYLWTFVAAVTCNTDLITSLIVARKGLGDMAVSSNIGSNIFHITVSLPMPWLLYSLIHAFTPVAVSSEGLACATVLLFFLHLCAVVSIISCKWKMNKLLGVTMLVLYSLFFILSIMLEYRIIVCPIGPGKRA